MTKKPLNGCVSREEIEKFRAQLPAWSRLMDILKKLPN